MNGLHEGQREYFSFKEEFQIMWQASNSRAKANADSKKRTKKNNASLHFIRVTGTLTLISPEPEHPSQTEIKIILNDLNEKSTHCFSPVLFIVGQEIRLEIKQPEVLSVLGQVIWCIEYTTKTHILSEKRCDYRVGIRFKNSPEEQQKLQAFIESIQKNYLYPVPLAA